MTEPTSLFPDAQSIEVLGTKMAALLAESYAQQQPFSGNTFSLPPIPDTGRGEDSLQELWRLLLNESTRLATPYMSGHMDTAPHPYAALTQGLVSALNNNMLFRELSPIASRIEENLIDDFISRLKLGTNWSGTWASGGSVANLTALFCAAGGYSDDIDRNKVHLLFPESGHASLKKAGAILGLPSDRMHLIKCDDAGRVVSDELRKTLESLAKESIPIVTSVLGSTIHGSLDDISSIGEICKQYNAWHHVDAIYGGALMFSKMAWPQLSGLTNADSIVIGPQKWMYVPRVSAVVLVKDPNRFDRRLGIPMPYSISGEAHRGFWGIQGSRPADAIVLWTLLQAIGVDAIGDTIDHSIQLTRKFHSILSESSIVSPTHDPDLNLLIITSLTSRNAIEIQKRLVHQGGFWASVSAWRGKHYIRSVLLSPQLTGNHLIEFRDSLEQAASG